MHPVADLCKLEGGEAHGHIVIPVLSVNLQPLVSGEDSDDFPLPPLQPVIPHAAVHPGTAGPGPRVTMLVDQVVGLVLHWAKAVHQFAGPVAVEA